MTGSSTNWEEMRVITGREWITKDYLNYYRT
jgi:hypothetical protein